MGTRNLTVVVEGGKIRVAQYGQWDGYPSGQGLTCWRFLREPSNVERLKRRIAWTRWIDLAELQKRWKSVGAKGDWATNAQAEAFKQKWPELSRDIGSEVLRLIADGIGVMSLKDDLAFATEGSCEWAWVVDFDERAFEAWCSYSSIPDLGSTRFDEWTEGKSAIHLVARFDLDALPSLQKFYADCGDNDAKVEDIAKAEEAQGQAQETAA